MLMLVDVITFGYCRWLNIQQWKLWSAVVAWASNSIALREGSINPYIFFICLYFFTGILNTSGRIWITAVQTTSGYSFAPCICQSSTRRQTRPQVHARRCVTGHEINARRLWERQDHAGLATSSKYQRCN